MNKPKIVISKKPLTEIERDIYTAAATPITAEEVKRKLKDNTVFEFEPDVIEELKKVGLTPEQLIEQMLAGKREGDDFFEIPHS